MLIDSNFIDTTSLETELELLKDEIRGSEESVRRVQYMRAMDEPDICVFSNRCY